MKLLFAPLVLLIVPFCGGCDTTGPGFRGIAATRITVGGDTFDVRVNGTRAEAIRLNSRWAPRLASVAPQGVAAIERVTDCRVRKLDGDAAVMTARLDCGQPLAPLPRGTIYDCDVYSVWDGLAELTCEEVR